MTTDVRNKREPVVPPRGERRVVASGSAAGIRKTIEEFKDEGLDCCASITHPSAGEIAIDLKKFADEAIRLYV